MTEGIKQDDYEKRYVYSLVGTAFAVSLILEWLVVYRNYPLLALKHWAFYQSVFQHLVLLAIVPYLIAWGAGKLLTLIAFILRDDKRYEPQRFIAWILIVTLSYIAGIMSVGKHDNLDRAIAGCMETAKLGEGFTQSQINSLQSTCANRLIPIYTTLTDCMRIDEMNARHNCINTALKSVGFQTTPSV